MPGAAAGRPPAVRRRPKAERPHPSGDRPRAHRARPPGDPALTRFSCQVAALAREDRALGAPWRVLILDRSGDNAKWIIATVSLSSDVRAAEMEPGGWRYVGWPAVTKWVRDRVGRRAR